MRAESHCDARADNTGLNSDGSNDKGIMQINSIHVESGLISEEARLDPDANVAAAYAIYTGALRSQGDGWKAWSSYNSGTYLTYL